MANPSTSSRSSSAAPGGGSKLTCLCSPTNHPGSFRCARHRDPRGRPQTSSSGRASQQQTAVPGVIGRGEAMSSSRTAKGRSSVLGAHLLRLVSPPSSAGRDHRRCRDFKPRPSRLGRLGVAA